METEYREVVVWSSTFMLRAHADLDRTYMDGGVLRVVVGVRTLALLWVRLYSLMFLTMDVIQQGIYSKNFFTKQPGRTSCWLQTQKSCDSFASLLTGSTSPVAPSPFVASPPTAILTASAIAWMVSRDRGSALCTCCAWGSGQFRVMCPGLLQL